MILDDFAMEGMANTKTTLLLQFGLWPQGSLISGVAPLTIVCDSICFLYVFLSTTLLNSAVTSISKITLQSDLLGFDILLKSFMFCSCSFLFVLFLDNTLQKDDCETSREVKDNKSLLGESNLNNG